MICPECSYKQCCGCASCTVPEGLKAYIWHDDDTMECANCGLRKDMLWWMDEDSKQIDEVIERVRKKNNKEIMDEYYKDWD